MANVYAVKSGNWSDTTVWNTGALPTSADDVFSNNFTVTIDGTFSVASISNQEQAPIITGGGFKYANGGDLTASIYCTANSGGNQLGYLLGFDLDAPSVATFRGNIRNGAGGSGYSGLFRDGTDRAVVIHSGSGILNIIGDISCNCYYQAYVARLTGTGTLNITGTVYSQMIDSNSAGYVLSNTSSGTINITGSILGGGGGNNITCLNLSNGTINVTGNVIGGSSGPGIQNNSTGQVLITGNCTGGGWIYGFATYNTSTGTITHIGTSYASATSPAHGTSFGAGPSYLSGPFISSPQGVAANSCYTWRWISGVGPSYMTVPNSTATGYKNLYSADNTSSASGQPATTNVRSGAIYGPSNELTGTCAVPAAGSVSLGVPIDNTTGTAVLTEAAVKGACSKAVVPALLALG